MGDVVSLRSTDALTTLLAACEEAKERPDLEALVILFDPTDPSDHYAVYSENVHYAAAHYVLTAIAHRQLDDE